MVTPPIVNYKENEQLSISCAKEIREICKPLFDFFGITGFTFQRMYKDGARLYFSSSETWIENFYDKNYFLASSFKKFGQLQSFNLWKYWPKEDNVFYQLMADAKENFSYANGIVIIRSYSEYMDAFTFRGNAKKDDSVNHQYLNEFQCIEKFLDYFYVVADPLISKAYKKKIIIPEDIVQPIYSNNEDFNEYRKRREDFLSSINHDRILIENAEKKFFLTKRESDCLRLMVRGQIAKEIAHNLSLSPRTVESYLLSIKLKLACASRSQIVEKVLAQPWNHELIRTAFKKENHETTVL
ncbi:MAG: LuxR C-terminal-related transcriptional regulator [Alphaproteobacteria bacterium]|nr:LuxR C-terminal-related transcriptional regulator [Alphaproteobacteria bacterium]